MKPGLSEICLQVIRDQPFLESNLEKQHPRRHRQQQQHHRGHEQRHGRVPTAPANCSRQRTNGSGLNRFVAEKTGEVIRQFPGGRVTLSGRLGQALEADCFEIPRYFGIQ